MFKRINKETNGGAALKWERQNQNVWNNFSTVLCKLKSAAIYLIMRKETQRKGYHCDILSIVLQSKRQVGTTETRRNQTSSIHFDFNHGESDRDDQKRNLTRWIFLCLPERVLSHLHHTLLLKLHLPFSHTHTHSVTLPSSPYCSNTSRRLWSSWHFYKSASLSWAAGCTSLLLGDDGKMSTDERCLSDNCVQMDTANNSFANQHFKANL